MSALPEVEVTDLWKSYPRPPWHLGVVRGPAPQALRGVSFDVLPGEVVALIGPNGAGKSTLLRILSGLLLPSRGRALVSQLDVVKDRPQSRRSIGATLSDDRGLSPRLTVRQNLQFFSALYGLPRSDLKGRIEDLSNRFEATALLDREVRTLSTGERARAILIRLLLHRPRAVLMDEITRFLDPGAAQRLRKQILREVAGRGAAVLFASHDLSEVQAVASRVLLLNRGQTAAFGPFSEVSKLADRVFATAPEPRAE
ncbi:MAG TPA: ABC transporter ATP-binding protein [Myxococcaceae bacterium]|nr:ABC transporter ATP-binding protein [Myxococcaceae bacterium]